MKPFPGLRPFDSTEADLFFGRDEQINELLARLGTRHFLAVVGVSGSGKSSLVRAGLIPALQRGYLGSPESVWRIAAMRPGLNPYGELARELARCFEVSSPDTILCTLRRSSLGLTDFIREHLRPPERLFLLVDQFEELIRYRSQSGDQGREESWAFMKLLLAASNQSEIPLPDAAAQPAYIVLTMRSDYLGRCAQFPGLPEALNDAQYLVPRLSRDQQREAIEGPIALAGAEITPQLVQRLLNDVGDSSDRLPVLQHALLRTWEASHKARAHGDALDISHYEAVGGTDGALNRDAEEAYRKFQGDPKREMIARRVFQRLVEPGAEDEASRRPTRLSELVAITESSPAEVQTVIDAFRERGFLFQSNDEDPLIDISHESLIRLWGRLQQWVKEEAESAAIYTRLADSAIRKLAVYRDPELSQAVRWKRNESPNAAWAQRYTPKYESGFSQAISFLRRSELWRLAIRVLVGIAFIAISVALVIAIAFYRDARQQRHMAESARQQAERLVESMVFDLRDKLAPIGRLDLLDDVNQRVNEYYKSLGSGDAPEYQRQWAVAQDNRGNVLVAQGKLAEALRAYEADRSIAQRLAQQDPSNTDWQRDLSISQEKVGDVLVAQGKLAEALRAYEADRSIAQRLAQQDPSNTDWQRDLSVSQNKVGNVLVAQGKLAEALRAYEADRTLRQRLAQQDPSNATWRDDLKWVQQRIMDMRHRLGKP